MNQKSQKRIRYLHGVFTSILLVYTFGCKFRTDQTSSLQEQVGLSGLVCPSPRSTSTLSGVLDNLEVPEELRKEILEQEEEAIETRHSFFLTLGDILEYHPIKPETIDKLRQRARHARQAAVASAGLGVAGAVSLAVPVPGGRGLGLILFKASATVAAGAGTVAAGTFLLAGETEIRDIKQLEALIKDQLNRWISSREAFENLGRVKSVELAGTHVIKSFKTEKGHRYETEQMGSIYHLPFVMRGYPLFGKKNPRLIGFESGELVDQKTAKALQRILDNRKISRSVNPEELRAILFFLKKEMQALSIRIKPSETNRILLDQINGKLTDFGSWRNLQNQRSAFQDILKEILEFRDRVYCLNTKSPL